MTLPLLRTGIAPRCPQCRGGEVRQRADALACTACDWHCDLESGLVDLTAALTTAEAIQRQTYDHAPAGAGETADPWHCFVTPGGLRYRRMLRRLLLGPGQRFLEVGCGAGPLTDSLASNTGALGMALDLSRTSIAAQMRRRGNRAGYDAVVASATDLPFADATFHAVVCTDLVEHLADPGAFYREAARVLQPGGQLLVRCNVRDFGLTFDWLRFHLSRQRWLRKMATLGHFYENFRTRRQHRQLAAEAGFRLRAHQGFDIGWDNILEYHVLPALYRLGGGSSTAGNSGEPPADGIRLRVPMGLPHRSARLLSRLLFVALWPEHLLGTLGFGASEWMLLQRA